LPAATQKTLHDLGTFTGKEGATPFFKLRLKNGSDPAKVKLALRKEPGILYVFDGDAAKVDRGSARSVKEHLAFLEALKAMAKPTDKTVKGIMAMSEGHERTSILKKKMTMMMACLGFGRPTPTTFKTA